MPCRGKPWGAMRPPTAWCATVVPCEDGHAHERSLVGRVLETVHVGNFWMQDRHVCPGALLGALDRRGAGCIIRQPEGLPCAGGTTRRSVGCSETGQGAEQRVQGRDAQGDAPLLRRSRVTLAQATRDGDRVR